MDRVRNINHNVYEKPCESKKVPNQDSFIVAEKNALNADERLLGIGFLHDSNHNISYGMRAEYSEDYSADNPIIKVKIQKGNGIVEEFDIDIRDVDPRNASEIEMFALCNYADANGFGTGGTFGSWQTLNYYRQNSSLNGSFKMTDTIDLFRSLKQDWTSMVDEMISEYMKGNLFKQSLDGKKLLDIFGKITNKVS